MLALVACSLKLVKLLGLYKRMQHCWPTTPNNVGSCWHLLHPFAWAFTQLVKPVPFKLGADYVMLEWSLKSETRLQPRHHVLSFGAKFGH